MTNKIFNEFKISARTENTPCAFLYFARVCRHTNEKDKPQKKINGL